MHAMVNGYIRSPVATSRSQYAAAFRPFVQSVTATSTGTVARHRRKNTIMNDSDAQARAHTAAETAEPCQQALPQPTEPSMMQDKRDDASPAAAMQDKCPN